jgi:hypothetical protein
MTKLTPEEARQYEQSGKIAAINAVRYRTNLGLIEAKSIVEAWIAAGKPVVVDERPSLESQTLEKLSDALTRLRAVELAIFEQRKKAIEIARRIMADAEKCRTPDERDAWYRACGRIVNALGNELSSRC